MHWFLPSFPPSFFPSFLLKFFLSSIYSFINLYIHSIVVTLPQALTYVHETCPVSPVEIINGGHDVVSVRVDVTGFESDVIVFVLLVQVS